ncbi:MAG: hypothetical protein IJY20_02805 [Clostridia bacterium]|nr:hypothetical protein [Clostridia bacterium]
MIEIYGAANRRHPKQLFLMLVFMSFAILLFFSPQVMDGIRASLQLCYQTIIPSLFPFMILSELLTAFLSDTKGSQSRVDMICRKIFAVPAVGMWAFFMGALCGFPLGVKFTADLYRTGKLNASEAEQLIAFSNNTGPAFVIAGIGSGLLKDAKIGLVLYVLQVVCSLMAGFLLARLMPLHHTESSAVKHPQEGGAVGIIPAIRRASGNILSVCGMIVAFSIPIALLRSMIKNGVLLAFISSFVEVGNAAGIAASIYETHPATAMLALTNTVCFGGLSVHLQASLFLSDLPLSIRRHTIGKLLQSALACLFLPLLFGWVL